ESTIRAGGLGPPGDEAHLFRRFRVLSDLPEACERGRAVEAAPDEMTAEDGAGTADPAEAVQVDDVAVVEPALQQVERLDDVRQLEPDVERPLAGAREGQSVQDAVAPAPIRLGAFRDRLLRPRQRCDPRLLDRPEDADARVVGEQVDPLDDLRVPDDESEPPA